MSIDYFIATLSAFLLSVLFTQLIKKLAWHWRIIDWPNSQRVDKSERHIHKSATPLLGGLAIFLSVVITTLYFREYLVLGNLTWQHWLSVAIGAMLIVIGGILDDKYNLSPGYQIIFPLLACLAVIAGGVGIEKISNPFGSLLFLNTLQLPIFTWAGHTYYFTVLSDIFTILWLMGMMYTTKLLDGLDGLVTGMAGIGSVSYTHLTLPTN